MPKSSEEFIALLDQLEGQRGGGLAPQLPVSQIRAVRAHLVLSQRRLVVFFFAVISKTKNGKFERKERRVGLQCAAGWEDNMGRANGSC